MREIKFRLYDGNNNYFEYPEVLELGIGLEYQQYTGLQDKNGVEIYEGDVIDIEESLLEKQPTRYTVEWDAHNAAFSLIGGGENWGMSYINIYPAYVVGDIYENPELLGGK